MKSLLLALLFGGSLFTSTTFATTTSPLSFYLHDTTGILPDTPLPAIYQVASTAEGSSTAVVLKAVNSSSSTISLATAFVGTSPDLTVLNSNFSVTGLFLDLTLSPQGSVIFTVNFIPTVTGTLTGYLQAVYQVQQGTCSFTSENPATQCPSFVSNVSTMTGAATAPELVLSYLSPLGSVVLQPSSGTPLNFGNISPSASATLTFTLANESSVDLAAPGISVLNEQFSSSAFALNAAAFPSTIKANSSATFTVTFAPGQTGVATAILVVGSNSYDLQGAGIVVADIDALEISYVDSTGVRSRPQAATPISFGQVVGDTGTSSGLAFTITNPATSYDAVSVTALEVSGAGFALTGGPAIPVSIAPGQSIAFTVSFVPSGAGNYSGTLTIGTRQFLLNGLSVASPLPAASFALSSSPLTSQQQVSLTIQLASASQVPAVGTLAMEFTPSIAKISDDPAVVFTATSGRQLNVSVAAGAQTATYNGKSAIEFQTGTTAGAIQFTLTFTNAAPYTQSFTITPAAIQIVSTTAQRQTPNLLVTVNGYDNTYTAGPVSFTFYDTKGNVIGSPAQVNAASNFQQLFFTNNQAGGAFALQASFPVNGDITQVGSVGVIMTNSSGQATTTQTFQ